MRRLRHVTVFYAMSVALLLAACQPAATQAPATQPAATSAPATLPPATAIGTGPLVLRLATTTSTADTGLLNAILPDFNNKYGARVGVVAVGTGQALVEYPDLRMISLTGSTATGKKIMRAAAGTLKRVRLEPGGKAPLTVFDNADVELVATKAALAATMNTGQDSTAATRVYVDQSRLGQVQEAVMEAMRAVKVGQPFDDDTLLPILNVNVHKGASRPTHTCVVGRCPKGCCAMNAPTHPFSKLSDPRFNVERTS